MFKLRRWLRRWLGMEADREMAVADIMALGRECNEKFAKIDSMSRMDADIGRRGSCTVILSGVYQGRGYVTFYDMGLDEFRGLVERFRHERREHLIRNLDVPPGIRGAFDLKPKKTTSKRLKW